MNNPEQVIKMELTTGEVGLLGAGIVLMLVGDTITLRQPCLKLPGYKPMKPIIFGHIQLSHQNILI